MTFTKIIAVAALVGAMATPALARDGWRHGRGGGYAGAAIAGAVLGTAAAIATAPRYGNGYYGDSYAADNGYYGNDGSYAYGPPVVYNQAPSYAVRQNGFVCQPGTYYRNDNGIVQFCQ